MIYCRLLSIFFLVCLYFYGCQYKKDYCENNLECQKREKCNSGVCIPCNCQTDSDCGSFYSCESCICKEYNLPKRCSCSLNSDCEKGFVCSECQCTKRSQCACDIDADCGGGDPVRYCINCGCYDVIPDN